jgi:succinyl-CoA synthetase beta subunit
MKIHEYQAKEILKTYDVRVPQGEVCFSPEEAEIAAKKIGGDVWGVKAQIHAGGRGKGGGVKIVKSLDDVKKNRFRNARNAVGHASNWSRRSARQEAPYRRGGKYCKRVIRWDGC